MIEFTSWEDPVIGLQVEPFNWRLRKARKARGWSRATLAREAGINAGVVGDAEKLRRVSSTARERIAFALEIPEDLLFPGVIDDLPKDGPGEIEIPFTEAQVNHWRETGSLGAGDEMAMLADRIGMTDAIDAALERLSPRERRLLRMRFGLGDGSRRTLDESAHELGVTRERIRQIEAEALRKLRQAARTSSLAEVADIEWGSTRRPVDPPSPFVAWLRDLVEGYAERGNRTLTAQLAYAIASYACCAAERTVTGLRGHLRTEHADDFDLWAAFDRLDVEFRASLRASLRTAPMAIGG